MNSPETVPNSPEAIKLADAVRDYSLVLSKNGFGKESAEIRNKFSQIPEFTEFADSLDKLKRNLSAIKP
jgi:hypothetical protein